MMSPDDKRQKAQGNDRVNKRSVTPERSSAVDRNDFGNNSQCRQDQHIDLGMGKEPKQVLPEKRVTTACNIQQLAGNNEPTREKKARSGNTIHQLHYAGGFKRWEREQQQKGRHELCPGEEGQTEERQSLDSELNGRDNEIYRPQKR